MTFTFPLIFSLVFIQFSFLSFLLVKKLKRINSSESKFMLILVYDVNPILKRLTIFFSLLALSIFLIAYDETELRQFNQFYFNAYQIGKSRFFWQLNGGVFEGIFITALGCIMLNYTLLSIYTMRYFYCKLVEKNFQYLSRVYWTSMVIGNFVQINLLFFQGIHDRYGFDNLITKLTTWYSYWVIVLFFTSLLYTYIVNKIAEQELLEQFE